MPDPGAKAAELVFAALCPWCDRISSSFCRDSSWTVPCTIYIYLKNNRISIERVLIQNMFKHMGFRNRCKVYQKRLWSAKSWTWHSTGQNGILFGSSGSIWAPNAGASISTNNIHRIMRCDPDMICAGYGSFLETHEPEIGQSWSFKGLLTDMEPVGRDFEVSWFWCLHLESLVVRELCPLTEWTCYHYNHWIIVFSTQEARATKPASTLAKLLISTNTCACRKVREDQSGKGGKCRWTT